MKPWHFMVYLLASVCVFFSSRNLTVSLWVFLAAITLADIFIIVSASIKKKDD